MANGRLQNLSQGHDLIVKSATCRPLRLSCFWINTRGHPVQAVFLDLSSRSLGYSQVFKEGNEVNSKADAVAFNPSWAALSLSDYFIFFKELLRDFLEGFTSVQYASPIFAPKRQAPIFRYLLCKLKASFFGGGAKSG